MIWDVGLTIASYFISTAGSILLDIAELFAEHVDTGRMAKAVLLHSFSYPEKDVMIYTAAQRWEVFFTSQPREWYRHEFASYTSTSGFTRTATKDFTGDLGYAPIQTEWSPHYHDHEWLIAEARKYWRWGERYHCESWWRYNSCL